MLKQAWRKPDPELRGKMSARSVEAKPCGCRAQARLWGPDAKGVWKRDHMSSLCFLENHIKDIHSVRPFVHVLTCLCLFNLSHSVKKEN